MTSPFASDGPALDRRRALGGIGACCAGLAGLGLLAGCESTEVAARTPDQRPLSNTDEAGIWRLIEKAEREIAVSPRRIRDPELEAYVTRVACSVAGNHCADMRVYLIRAPFFNASMAPNGMMQVWSGLLLRVDNEAQLAGVLAHEAGHFIERHSLENFRRLKNNATAALFFGMAIAVTGGGALANIATLIAAADLMAFSRDQERHADRIGLELMAKAGYAPGEVARVWKNIVAESEADPYKKKRDLFLSSHPAGEERMQTMDELAAPLRRPGQRTGQAEYLEAVRPLRQTLLEDELALRQPERTLHLLARLQEAEADAADLHHFAGEARRLRGAAGDAEAAHADYEAALRADPAYAPGWRGLGLLERSAGHDDAARAAFRRYLELNPEAPDAAFLQAYLAQGS